MLISTLNLNGTRSALRKGFKGWLFERNPDVLCLQEVRARLEDLPEGLFEGYQVFWKPAEKLGYAGTAVLVKEEFPCRELEIPLHSRAKAEGRLAGVALGGLEIWSIYFPSGSSGPERQQWKMEFLGWMEPFLEERRRRAALVAGDINIVHTPKDIKNAKGNEKNSGFLPEEREWLTRLFESGYRDLFRELNPELVAYSWWSSRGRARENNVGWRLDQFWGTDMVQAKAVWIEGEARLSDHAPVHISINELVSP
jgi:exodeoxyribonuclease-3